MPEKCGAKISSDVLKAAPESSLCKKLQKEKIMAKIFPKVYSAELEGIEAKLIEVETDVNVGLHSLILSGWRIKL